ncbi:uncharacterized protein LOC123009515 [Tribolium madens]|uniref:uncharacterized protein LOC123009515 n=1 Tax=Tribolium madens TaxID=41895 RepID=UPI001CF73262|nr:uncharacterized protein LOC123009515 [Tribolium madens]
MALLRKNFSDIPPDAVILSEEEALKYQSKLLNTWKNTSDIFGYKFGPYILSAAGFFSGFFLNSYYRQKFKLLGHGRASTYLPVCILPATFSLLTHVEFVQKDVVLQKRGTCPTCLEMRGAAIQALIGCVFPTVLAPMANLSLAHRYVTFNVPDLAREPGKVFNLIRAKSQPISTVLLAIFLGQAFFGALVTYLEAKSVINVNTKLAELERQLENS